MRGLGPPTRWGHAWVRGECSTRWGRAWVRRSVLVLGYTYWVTLAGLCGGPPLLWRLSRCYRCGSGGGGGPGLLE